MCPAILGNLPSTLPLFHFQCGLLSSLFEYDIPDTLKHLNCWSALENMILSCDNFATFEACLAAKAHLDQPAELAQSLVIGM